MSCTAKASPAATARRCRSRRAIHLLLHPGSDHVVENTGAGKLYCLTVMTPNEGFAELIRGGERVEIEADDIRILQGR